jgi:nucleoside-diphosphate-sugar epimerase/predicted dehydrogenase
MAQHRWKVGLLGAGYICEAHAKALQRRTDTEIVAVCDHSRTRAEEAAARFGIPRAYSSLDDMLHADVNVVHVLLPPDRHIDATRRILESGRHAFVEKPMGVDSAECRALADLARQKKVKLGVDHNFLFLPSFEKLRRDAIDGTLGKLDQITVNWMYPLGLIQSGPFNNWILKEPGNLFFELGPHLVAFVMDLVGPLERIQTSVARPIDLPGGSRVYRHWHVHGQKGQTAIDLILSVVPGPAERSITVRGHGAVAKCDFDRDLYYRDEPTGYGLQFDNFFTALNVARQLAVGAARNVFYSVAGTLRKAPSSNPFDDSVARCLDRYYTMIDAEPDSRLDGQFGANVIAECERIVSGAAFELAESDRKAWAVIPPKHRPTVLVIGGTGFIGQYLVRVLVARGIAVRVVTRSMSSAQIVFAGLPVELMQGDLAEPSFIDGALENIEVVYDLAKAVGSKWEDYYQHDVLVTQNIAQRALAKGVKRFVYTGTIDSYYSARAGDVITSDTPLDPKIAGRNHYARSKAACEALLMELHRKHGLPVVICRPGIVIGKGCPPAHWGVGTFLSDTRMQFWGDGRNKLPFVLVEDVANALAFALDKPNIEGQAFLLTDEPLLNGRDYVEAVSTACGTRMRTKSSPAWKYYAGDLLKEAAKHLIRHPNRKIPSYRDWDSKSHRARYDSAKTRNVLGWKPVGTREALIERGIVEAVCDFTR